MWCGRNARALLAVCLIVCAAASATIHPGGTPSHQSAIAAQKLRVYCRACHGVGELRFIHDGASDAALWSFLFTQKAPKSKRLWAEAIIASLSWPSDEPPPLDQEDRFMPQGIKRLQLAEDRVDGVPARQLILDALKHR